MAVSKRKNISVEKMLGNLTPEQLQAFADCYNGGLGSGRKPEQKAIKERTPAKPNKKDK